MDGGTVMFKFLVKWIFMDKRARDAAKKMRDVRPTPPVKEKPEKPANEEPTAAGAAKGDDERAALIEQTMALYRQRHEEYEQLDEGVREKMMKLASDKLSDKDS